MQTRIGAVILQAEHPQHATQKSSWSPKSHFLVVSLRCFLMVDCGCSSMLTADTRVAFELRKDNFRGDTSNMLRSSSLFLGLIVASLSRTEALNEAKKGLVAMLMFADSRRMCPLP